MRRCARSLGDFLSPILLVHFRLSRGMTFGVRGAVIDERTIVCSWSSTPMCPAGTCRAAGSTLARRPRRRCGGSSTEEGNIRVDGAGSSCVGLYQNRRAATMRDHVAFFLVRHFVQTGPRPPDQRDRRYRLLSARRLPADTTRGDAAHGSTRSPGAGRRTASGDGAPLPRTARDRAKRRRHGEPCPHAATTNRGFRRASFARLTGPSGRLLGSDRIDRHARHSHRPHRRAAGGCLSPSSVAPARLRARGALPARPSGCARACRRASTCPSSPGSPRCSSARTG